ncbi:hypothetical protein A2Y99_00280 [Candidatus Gottesmanbacteria bacterium RBG_13_37_7]|uniref:Double zinc ribbon domain-containing protein n=1 Tax=Candidatus Gottesmanbacteria bacterium RBG_13_37_7 TaxID=1798369 RepID=A0A1F5YH19_9BACT|nr:MAG: hypothetical protein A2Y99_00280 [Candidatus Gottesmanbacteria bacterium RBG_13_37_7]
MPDSFNFPWHVVCSSGLYVLDLIFPKRCVSCGRLGKYICQQCLAKIEFTVHPICPVCSRLSIGGITHPRCQTACGIDGMFALARYRGPLKDAIHLIKYKFISDIAVTLCDIFLEHYPDTLPRFDIYTPVPLHKKREKERGFNQSFLFAEILGKKLNIPVETFLEKTRSTIPQVKLSLTERKKNLRGAFNCFNKNMIKGRVIGLIDDVATTRSTIIECAKVLKRNGAGKVWGLVLAHG